ncbi:MAG: aminotransferase class I/II-fold pyridoxal phosphate-dependent enzyme [Planctomycetia bacterium]
MSEPARRLLAQLARGLAAEEAQGRRRRLVARAGLDLSSNDVLGLAEDPWVAERVAEAVRRHGTGAGAARLLRGNLALFEEAEARLAAACGREAALLFPSGYMASQALLATLLRVGGSWASDRDNHACIVDGLRLGRQAQGRVGRLDDPTDPCWAFPASAPFPRLAVVESVISTSGRLPDLACIADLAEEAGAVLLVDEAHATGLWGAAGGPPQAAPSGRVAALGLSSRVLATMHTGGKALGVAGAWVAGERTLIEHLVQHARPFVFTTAPMPALAAGLLAALERLATRPGAGEEVRAKAGRLRTRLRAGGVACGGDGTHLVPVPMGSEARALEVAGRLQAEGFDVRALRPPTVPVGGSCLRLVVRRPLAEDDLERFAARLVHHAHATAAGTP